MVMTRKDEMVAVLDKMVFEKAVTSILALHAEVLRTKLHLASPSSREYTHAQREELITEIEEDWMHISLWENLIPDEGVTALRAMLEGKEPQPHIDIDTHAGSDVVFPESEG